MNAEESNTGAAANKSPKDNDNDDEKSAPKEARVERTDTKKSYNSGKWTPEEFEYMIGLMEAFKAGHLPLQEGTTLRSFLSSMMKCKPKRISKKFEGIAYNGRLTYQKSKEPLNLQGAMLLRARLSELERRYLAAAAEQREGADGVEALLKRESTAGLLSDAKTPLATTMATMPFMHPDPSGAHVMQSNNPGGELASAGISSSDFNAAPGYGLGMGLRMTNKDMMPSQSHASSAQFGGQTQRDFPLATSLATRSRDSSLLNQAAGGDITLLSAGLASGTDAYRNILLAQQGHGNSRVSILEEYQNQLRETERQSALIGYQKQLRALEQQQQQLLSSTMSGMNASSSLAALQLRERSLGSNNMTQISSSSFQNSHLPGTGYQQDVLPSVEHHMDLNRFVLQAPQDDATYFRQRLLPGMAAAPAAPSAPTAIGNSSSLGLQSANNEAISFSNAATSRGALSQMLKRQLEESEKFDPSRWKRQR